MNLKEKVVSAVATHPKLLTFAMGFAITLAVGTALGGLVQGQEAFAARHTFDHWEDGSSSP